MESDQIFAKQEGHIAFYHSPPPRARARSLALVYIYFLIIDTNPTTPITFYGSTSG